MRRSALDPDDKQERCISSDHELPAAAFGHNPHFWLRRADNFLTPVDLRALPRLLVLAAMVAAIRAALRLVSAGPPSRRP